MECPFQVGDEVTLRDRPTTLDSFTAQHFNLPLPKWGETYTVRGFDPNHDDNHVGLLFKEIGFTDPRDGREGSYCHTFFEKMAKPKRETSIEVFKEIDRKVFERQPEKVRA